MDWSFLKREMPLRGPLFMVSAVVATLTMAGFLAREWWRFELLAHFRVQYLLGLLACALFFYCRKLYWRGSFSLGFALVNLALVAPLYFGGSSADTSGKRYRAILVNVHTQSEEYGRLVEFIRETRPDFISILEVDNRWLAGISELRAEYPYRVEAIRVDNFGIVFLSKVPILSGNNVESFGIGLPSTVARIDLDGVAVTVVGSHPLPPAHPDYAKWRDERSPTSTPPRGPRSSPTWSGYQGSKTAGAASVSRPRGRPASTRLSSASPSITAWSRTAFTFTTGGSVPTSAPTITR